MAPLLVIGLIQLANNNRDPSCKQLAEADTDIAFFLVRGQAEATWSNEKKT
ncbi:hypothetical protein DAPPUDRAFT_233801 [Daphnia pulex]|uniref:Uncharacterized protein n=1 Tax=Daphnia pulex TaxID=6669 RepID=E9FVS0_DAPPU|nr:hypothetical protein DAPPUDRAFT_233801 [Daphnia pulex]|eukprot:EFX88603.1 hypothetical protein DAPPUDRAFT_233801 [Daphnia pulex]